MNAGPEIDGMAAAASAAAAAAGGGGAAAAAPLHGGPSLRLAELALIPGTASPAAQDSLKAALGHRYGATCIQSLASWRT